MAARHGRKGLSSAMRRVFGEMPAKQGSGEKKSGRASGQRQKSSKMVRVDLYTRVTLPNCRTLSTRQTDRSGMEPADTLMPTVAGPSMTRLPTALGPPDEWATGTDLMPMGALLMRRCERY
jgi:hypothetical protein